MSIFTSNMSILLPVYPYYSVLVSDTFLDDAIGTSNLKMISSKNANMKR